MKPDDDTSRRHAYRTASQYEMDERRLTLRGGVLDGRSWTGLVAVGKRAFCGEGDWSKEEVYLVTAEVEIAADGAPTNVAVPAFASEDATAH
jgi:hypothetical protein